MTTQRVGDYLMGAWWFIVAVLFIVALWYHLFALGFVAVLLMCAGLGIEMERGSD